MNEPTPLPDPRPARPTAVGTLEPPASIPGGLPWKIALIYTAAGALWILLSDQALVWLRVEPDTLLQLQTYKGWLFVGVTAALLFLLLQRYSGIVGRFTAALEQSRVSLQDSAEFNRQIIAHVQEGIMVSDREGRLVLWNSYLEQITGLPAAALVGRRIPELNPVFPFAQAQRLGLLQERALQGEIARAPDHAFHIPDTGRSGWATAQYAPLRDGHGRITGVLCTVHLITERKRMEVELRQSELRYRRLFESHPHPLWVQDREIDRFLAVNAAAVRHYGYAPEEFQRLRPSDLAPDQAAALSGAAGASPADPVLRHHRKRNGEIIEVELTAHPLDFGGRPAEVVLALDVTERRARECALRQSHEQLRALTARLHAVREEESRRIAREVHDQIGQALTSLNIDVAWLRERLPSATEPETAARLQERLSRMSQIVRDTIHTVQRISAELRPGILDDLGLPAAVESTAEDFERRTGIPCLVAAEPVAGTLHRDAATAVFRILQEALANVVRHAHAHEVHVRLRQEDAALVVDITDDGCGIAPHEANRPTALGLLSMRERAAAAGGDIRILGGPGQGTTIRVSVPLNSANAAER